MQVCCRILQHCIKSDGNGTLRAHPLPDTGQGTLLRAHAMPMPCRTADIASIIYMNDCLPLPVEGEAPEPFLNKDSIPSDRYCRIHKYHHNSSSFKANFFKSVMCTIYGQTRGLTTFFQSKDNTSNIVLPTHLQAATFVKHIKETCDDNLAKHYQAQYKDSIPDPLKLKRGTAIRFIETLALDWNDEIDTLFASIAWSDKLDSLGNSIPEDRSDIIL